MTLDPLAPVATAPASPETGSRAALSSDLDTFLKLLTAQIRNQDPLEPADGTEYAAQLAQFSNVEQAVRTNELLSDLTAAMSGGGAADAAAWIGLEVRHDGPVHVRQGVTTRLTLDTPSVADRAQLVAVDHTGAEVMRRTIDPDAAQLDWFGGDGKGGQLADGAYNLSVEAWSGALALDPRPVRSFARVEEVALAGAGPLLVLEGGARVTPDRLDVVRSGKTEPGAGAEW